MTPTTSPSLVDTLFPPGTLLRGGTMTQHDFSHFMAGNMVLIFALLTQFVHDDFIYGVYFIVFMLYQCAVTGFAPPKLVAKHILGLPAERPVVQRSGAEVAAQEGAPVEDHTKELEPTQEVLEHA